MPMPILKLLTRCRTRLDAVLTDRFGADREGGYVVEAVVVIATGAVIAIAAMAIISGKVDAKVNGLHL